VVPDGRKWLWGVLAALLAGIAYATLGPEGWQIRLGLPYLVEHFLAYFTLTTLACLAWPRPLRVAAVLVPFAVALEAAQGLTPDRTPDLDTALSAAAAVVTAALVAALALALWRKRRKP
jgi:VanZ family protein